MLPRYAPLARTLYHNRSPQSGPSESVCRRVWALRPQDLPHLASWQPWGRSRPRGGGRREPRLRGWRRRAGSGAGNQPESWLSDRPTPNGCRAFFQYHVWKIPVVTNYSEQAAAGQGLGTSCSMARACSIARATVQAVCFRSSFGDTEPLPGGRDSRGPSRGTSALGRCYHLRGAARGYSGRFTRRRRC